MIDWTHWHNEAYLIGGLVFFGWLYALVVGPWRRRIAPAAPFPTARAVAFYSAILLFYLAVGSPLDQIGERFLFSAHMVQHVILVYPVAVLWLVGLPPWLVDRCADVPGLRAVGRVAFHPVFCGIVYVMTQSIWHVPTLYDLALQNKAVHVLEHVMFFGSGLLYWWPVISVSRAWPPLPYAARMVYLWAVTVGMTPLFAFIAFSPSVLYPTYEFAPRLIATFSPEQDQLLAAVIMKLGGLVVTLTAFVVVFYYWYQATERSPRAVLPTRAAAAK